MIDQLELSQLAQRFGTPLYVVSETQLRRNVRAFSTAFSHRWAEGEVLIMPSIKANLALALRCVLTEEGAGCDTFGAGELDASLRTGVDPSLISLNGSTKEPQLIERAVDRGVRITLDSLAELELVREAARRLGVPAQVRFRLRPWLDLDVPTELLSDPVPMKEAIQRYKPGIPTEQLLGLDRGLLQAPELDVRGVMVHIGRQGRETRIWEELGRWVGKLVGSLGEAWGGWRPSEIDLGGGFPVPRDPFGGAVRDHTEVPAVPTIDEYAVATTRGLREGLANAGVSAEGIRLEIEPGRSLYGNAGLHLARVRHVKRQAEPIPYAWVETDTSEIFLADVVFERTRWNAIAVDRADQEPSSTADIVGISCNPDVIVPRARLPEIEAGDVIAFLDTGAYQDANASNFNALQRPGTVLVNGADAELIKRPDAVADVFARDRVPERLRAHAGDSPSDDGTAAAAHDGKPPGSVGARGLDHVSVTCADLDRSLAFYVDLLGLPLRDRGEAEGGEIAAVTGLDGVHVRWADLELGGGQVLELLQYRIPEGRDSHRRFFDPGGGHVSLRVPSVADAHACLRAAGVSLRSEPVELTEPGAWRGSRCFYAFDPDGVVVELIEHPADGG